MTEYFDIETPSGFCGDAGNAFPHTKTTWQRFAPNDFIEDACNAVSGPFKRWQYFSIK